MFPGEKFSVFFLLQPLKANNHTHKLLCKFDYLRLCFYESIKLQKCWLTEWYFLAILSYSNCLDVSSSTTMRLHSNLEKSIPQAIPPTTSPKNLTVVLPGIF